MPDGKRQYRMNARAESQQATRRRITDSAVELHGTLGPARTSMSAIAAHAGVRRSTLYRHFADEGEVFQACTAHWLSENPLPEIARWAAMRDPDERLHYALTELYAFYGRAESMLSNILRDVDSMEVVRQQFAQVVAYMEAAQTTLLAGRPKRGRRASSVRAAVGHAMAFTTWRSLVREQGCTASEAVELMCRLAV
jgi:AcrR family transcriptional regulator